MPNSLDDLKRAQLHMLRARTTCNLDAAELVRGWLLIADAAARAHDRLPTSDRARVAERINLMSAAMDASNQTEHWPGRTRPSPALEGVHSALLHAARSAAPVTSVDIETAHKLLVSILWVGAELVGERARDHAFDLTFNRVPNSGLEQAAATSVAQRMKAVETLALTGSLSPGIDADPVAVALAQWDVAAHRVLLTERSTVTLQYVATLEVATFDAFRAATARAQATGILDSVSAGRMDPAIEGAATAWRDVARVAGDFSYGHALPSAHLLIAGDEVRARFLEVAASEAAFEDVDILGSLAAHLTTSMSLTGAARDLVDDRTLLAPARAINRELRNIVSAEGRLGSIVSATDLHQGRIIALPAEARCAIRAPLDGAYSASAEALRRSAALDPMYRSTATESEPRTQRTGIGGSVQLVSRDQSLPPSPGS